MPTEEEDRIVRTYNRPSVTAEAAEHILRTAKARAVELGVAVSIAVLDDSGVLKAFGRMDGAPLPAVQLAQDKAYTAVGFEMPTEQWRERLEGDPVFAIGGPAAVHRLVVFGGGYPLTVDGHIVGALGVSGAHVSQDIDIAQVGASALD